MTDRLTKVGKQVDCQQLSRHLGCPVIPMVATNKQGIQALQAAIIKQQATVGHQVRCSLLIPLKKP